MSVEELEAFLENKGIAWSSLHPNDRHAAVGKWINIFDNAFDNGMRYKEGLKARYALSQVKGSNFLLFPITSVLPRWRSSENCLIGDIHAKHP